MPSFAHRHTTPERMDDLSIAGPELDRALVDLRHVGRLLGGPRLSLRALAPHLVEGRAIRVLDVGTGGADFPEALVRWAARGGHDVVAEGVDVNPVTLAFAARALDRRLPAAHRPRVTLREADARTLPYPDGSFDVAHAALFLHHFAGDEAVAVLREMGRVARVVVVNDLHRHPVAYHAIRVLGRLSPSPMFRHDAPLSVLRAFRRSELLGLARAAGLDAIVTWHWAFRWVLVGTRL